MLDRASTFADPEVIRLLSESFVPVAIDQFNQRQQEDAEGDFWRQIAGQGPRDDFDDTTQGHYIASPGGKLYHFSHHRGPERLLPLLQETARKHLPGKEVVPLDREDADPRFLTAPPPGATVIRVHAVPSPRPVHTLGR